MSEYVRTLSSKMKLRYCDKVTCINSIDPYTLTNEHFLNDQSALPKVTLLDIMTYFVLTHSTYTSEQIKAYKSLEAYKYFKAGFVDNVNHVEINKHFVVLAKVKHSQKMNAPNLQPWVILTANGSIKTGHCTCMAGLGESCSHIAPILFYIFFHTVNSLSCTSQLSTWTVPKYSKKVDFKQVQDMNWSKKCTSYDDRKRLGVIPLENSKLQDFLEKIRQVHSNAVIFRVAEPFASADYAITKKNSVLLRSLRCMKMTTPFETSSLDELRRIRMELKLSIDQQDCIFLSTLNRCNTQVFYEQQAGRIIDGVFKNTCSESVEEPLLTLIKRICYPVKMAINIPSEKYESKKKIARDSYYKQAMNSHKNLKIYYAGLIVHAKFACFAASPDFLLICDCCDEGGCVEIKCPYQIKELNLSIKEFAELSDSYLIKNEDGFSLDKTHSYYYQVQFQMFCADVEYCDFVLWSKKELLTIRIHIDKIFLQENLTRAKNYHEQVIVPELLGKYFTRENNPNRSVKWLYT